MTGTRIVVALGGNAIKQAHEAGTVEEQRANVMQTALSLADIVKKMGPEDRLVVTHGNGPQAGNLAVQNDIAKDSIPAQPFDILGSMTQGQIGYMLQNTLQNLLIKANHPTPVIALINQVLVSKDDPEFQGENASKPIGNFLLEEEAMKIKAEKGWIMKKVKPTAPKPWRRVVPSPDPVRNVEAGTINKLIEAGVVVIASGGGGIPVIQLEDGTFLGVEAVIDKDLAGEKMAEAVEADTLLILTDVEQACVNYGKPDQKPLKKLTTTEAKKMAPHFLAGSMGPKVRACIRFVEAGGKRAIITSLDKATAALAGETGTTIVQDPVV